MGLFNRNKGDASAPSTLGAATPPADNSTFDFDAISRDLDAQNGASSFDSLLAAPVNNAQQVPEGSTLDFPENDPLGLSTPATNVPNPVTTPLATSPEAVINAPLNSSTPTTGVAPLEHSPRVPPAVVTEVPKAKKPLPLVPLLGALGLLAVAGGGAMFLLNSNQEPETTAPAPPPAMVRNDTPSSSGSPIVPPTRNVAPIAPGGPPAPLPPQVGLRSASPGIAPPPAPKKPIQGQSGKSSISVSVGQGLINRAPSATAGLDPAMASRLKALWRAGADAKHRRDYKGARDAWAQALTLRPNHPGFQDAINKLPR